MRTAEKAPGLRARNYRKRQGRCYELAYNYLMESDDAAQWTLVHGEVGRHPAFGHAWLERHDAVYDVVADEFFRSIVSARAWRGQNGKG